MRWVPAWKKRWEHREVGWICVAVYKGHQSRIGRDFLVMPVRHRSMCLESLCAAAVHTDILFSNARYILYFSKFYTFQSSINFKVNPAMCYSASQ